MKKILISIVILFFAMLTYSCYASSFNFTAETASKTDKLDVNPGDEVFITLKVADITAPDGINVVETTLNYDKSIIDSLEFIEKNNWKSTYNSNQGNLYGKLLYSKMVTGVKDDEEIGILKVKIKENLNPFKTEIKLLQVTSNDGFELMKDGDKTVTLSYTKTQPKPNPPTPDNTTNEPTPSNEVEPSNEVTTNNEIKPVNEVKPSNTIEAKNEIITNNTKQEEPVKKEEPINIVTNFVKNAQTGDIIGLVCVLLLIALILSVVLFVISRKKKDDKK